MAFHGDAKELGRKGGLARMAKLTPERRSLIAATANYKRWYHGKSDTEARIDDHLRALAMIASKGMAEGDDLKVIRAITAMASYERMKMCYEASQKDVTDAEASEVDAATEKKLAEARRRRAAALELEDGTAVVVEEKNGEKDRA